MTEEVFRKEILESARYLGFHVVDIPDELKKALVSLPMKYRFMLARRIQQKPYDLGLLDQGQYFALELKLVKTGFTFNFNQLETHQLEKLYEAKESGAKSFVVINFRKTLTTEQCKKYTVNRLLNETYLLSPEEIMDYLVAGVKSFNLKDFRDKARFIEMDSNNLWKLDRLHSF